MNYSGRAGSSCCRRIRRLNWDLNGMKFTAVACIIYLLLSLPVARRIGAHTNLSFHKTNSFWVMTIHWMHYPVMAEASTSLFYLLLAESAHFSSLLLAADQQTKRTDRPAFADRVKFTHGRRRPKEKWTTFADGFWYLNITNPFRLSPDRLAEFNLLSWSHFSMLWQPQGELTRVTSPGLQQIHWMGQQFTSVFATRFNLRGRHSV